MVLLADVDTRFTSPGTLSEVTHSTKLVINNNTNLQEYSVSLLYKTNPAWWNIYSDKTILILSIMHWKPEESVTVVDMAKTGKMWSWQRWLLWKNPNPESFTWINLTCTVVRKQGMCSAILQVMTSLWHHQHVHCAG